MTEPQPPQSPLTDAVFDVLLEMAATDHRSAVPAAVAALALRSGFSMALHLRRLDPAFMDQLGLALERELEERTIASGLSTGHIDTSAQVVLDALKLRAVAEVIASKRAARRG